MPKASTDPSKRTVVANVSPEAHKAVRMFAAMNDMNNEQVIEHALIKLKDNNPDYELGLIEAPKLRRGGKGRVTAAE